MKFKVGDKVRVVWLHYWQSAFKIGDIVTITKEHPEGSPPHYSVDIGGGNIWWLTDEEIELYEEKKMSKYTTEPIDYTGCHPVIAEHLKRGEAILCRVWGYGTKEEWQDQRPERVIAFKGGPYPYTTLDSSGSWLNAEPIPIKRKVPMSAEKAVAKLIENGATIQDCEKFITLFKDYEANSEANTKFLEDYAEYLFEEVDD